MSQEYFVVCWHYVAQLMWVTANVVWAVGELWTYALFESDDWDYPIPPNSTYAILTLVNSSSRLACIGM